MHRSMALVLTLALALPAAAATKLFVTVIDRKTGEPVTNLNAADFTVTVDNTARAVEACDYTRGTIDVLLLLDSSLIGEAVASFAPALISQLADNEQMAIVAYDAAADLIQHFTSSKDLLRAALDRIKFGNSPKLLDALYAAAADGFQGASFRRVLLLLTSGIDAPGRVTARDVVRIARRNNVSIYPVYMIGYGRSQLQRLARDTGGASFSLRDMSRAGRRPPAERIFDVMRGRYTLTLRGNLPLGENLKLEVRGKKNLLISYVEMN